jgi:hypothetical protein
MHKHIFHIGSMRAGSSWLQTLFSNHAQIDCSIKNRFFGDDRLYAGGQSFYLDQFFKGTLPVRIDSDENYSLGRFKDSVRSVETRRKRVAGELDLLSHDIEKMADRLYAIVPEASILYVIREQASWFASVYRHDIQHFGVRETFASFLTGRIGQAYQKAANYERTTQIFADRFGRSKIHIILFEDLVRREPGALSTLKNLTGIELSPEDASPQNVSLIDGQLKCLRFWNRSAAQSEDRSDSLTYRAVRNILTKIPLPEFGEALVPKNILAPLKAEFTQGNYAIAAAYGLESQMARNGYLDPLITPDKNS